MNLYSVYLASRVTGNIQYNIVASTEKKAIAFVDKLIEEIHDTDVNMLVDEISESASFAERRVTHDGWHKARQSVVKYHTQNKMKMYNHPHPLCFVDELKDGFIFV